MGVRERGGVGVSELGEEEVEYIPGIGELEGLSLELGFSLFSFWRLLQNHTLTTSFSKQSPSETYWTSSLVGLGLELRNVSIILLVMISSVLFIPILFIDRFLV